MAEGEAIEGDGESPAQQVDSRLIALRELLVKAGLIVDLQRDDGDWFIACAAQRGPDGLYGNSIRLAFRDERMFVSTLTDRSYVVPDGANLAQLCRDCVDSSESTMDRLSDDVVQAHGLQVVVDER